MTLHNDHGPFSRLTPTVFSTLLAIIIYQAFLALFHGNLTKSRALWRAADKLVTETAEVANTIYYESHRLLYAYFVRDIHYGSVAMDRALQTAHQSGLPMGIAVCSMLHFWFSALLGNHTQREIPAEALPIRDGASTLGASHHLALYAQVYIARNKFAKAQEVIDLCRQNVERCGDIFMVSCLYHAEAQLLRAKGHTETEIHAAYQRAIAATQTQSVPYLELRIALDYAGYLVELGQSAVARDLLQGVLAQVEQVTDDYYVGASLRLLDRIGV